MNCKTESSQSPACRAIQLPSRTSLPPQFLVGNSRMILNDRGFYELQEEPTPLELSISELGVSAIIMDQ